MPAFLMMLFHLSDSSDLELRELGGRRRERVGAGRAVVLLHRRALARLDQDVVQLAHDRGRRVRRHVGGEPEAHVVALEPASLIVGSSGASGERFGVDDAERAHLAALHLRQAGRHVGDHHVDLPAEQVVDRERIALVRDVQQLDARHLLEHLARHARRRAAAAEADLAGLRLRERDELRDASSPAARGCTIMICPPLPSPVTGT